MNERIKELKDQCWVEKRWDNGMWIEKHIDLELFAELIVRECAKVAWYHTPDTEELEYSHLIEDKILKHFGVEE